MTKQTARQWLLLIYKVPADPTRFRTYIWRQMRTLGSLNLQQMVCLLPKTPIHEAEFERLAAKIEDFGGEVSLLTTTSPNAEWEEKIIERFNATRNDEYAEVGENEERFQDEIRRESRKERFTFTELEDMEADREKINREMAKIQARDFFGASGRSEAMARMAESVRLLEEFSRQVYEHERVEEPVGPQKRRESPAVEPAPPTEEEPTA